MEYIDLKTAKREKTSFFPFGVGTTANCYHMKNGKVLKLYKESSRKQYMFYLFDGMKEHLEELARVSNTSFVGPRQIIMKGEKCVGYTYFYRPACTLDKLSRDIRLDKLLDHYDILKDDTAKISETHFSLKDLHTANMLYDDCFAIIDLDMGTFDDKDIKDVFEHNMTEINDTIIYGIFGLEPYLKLTFKDDDLQKLYRECTLSDYRKIGQFLKEMSTYRKKLETIGDVQTKGLRLINVENNDYYSD